MAQDSSDRYSRPSDRRDAEGVWSPYVISRSSTGCPGRDPAELRAVFSEAAAEGAGE